MRRPLALVSLIAVAVLVSACAASQAPGWTYAPPTPAPTPGPSQSAGASAGPSAAAASAAAPSAGASEAAPSAGSSAAAPSGAAGGTVIDLTAQNIAFQQTSLSAPANTPFTIHFDNQDTSTIHNVVIKDSSGAEKFSGDLITGPAQADYQVPALPAGTYTFVCAVHANMTGTLTVGP
jgi:plastocyanin